MQKVNLFLLNYCITSVETRIETLATESDFLAMDKEKNERNEDGNARKRRKTRKRINALSTDDENSTDKDVALKPLSILLSRYKYMFNLTNLCVGNLKLLLVCREDRGHQSINPSDIM